MRLGSIYFRFTSVLVSVLLPTLLAAQNGSSGDVSALVGVPADASIYPIPGLGVVNLNNGNLHVNIPIRTIKGRNGVTETMSIVYDTSVWRVNQQPSTPTQDGQYYWATLPAPSLNDFQNSVGITTTPTIGGQIQYDTSDQQPCGTYDTIQTYQNWRFIDANGTIHPFYFNVQTQQVYGTDNTCTSYPNAQGYATDGSGYWIVITNFNGATVYDLHGNVVSSGTDSNGNHPPANWTDRLGRSLNLPSGYTITNKTISVWTNFNSAGTAEMHSVPTQYWTPTVMSSLSLPNGTSYSFQYDEAGSPAVQGHYGTLTGITLPTGGHISIVTQPNANCFNPLAVSQITTPDGTWDFSYTSAVSGGTVAVCSGTATVTAPPDPITGVRSQTTSNLSEGGGVTHTVSIYAGSASGTPLRTIATQIDGYLRPTKVTTTLDSGLSRHTDFTYWDSCTKRLQTKKEYDFSGNLARETDVSYPTDANDNNNLCSYFSYANQPTWHSPYLQNGHHIADIPSSITVYGQSSSGTSPVAQTLFTYDSTALGTTSGPSGTGSSVLGLSVHDDQNYGASMTYRGNLTVVQKMTSPSHFITTQTNYYNILGDLVQTTDANTNLTTYDYTDVWRDSSCISSQVFAYPTTVTDALGHQTHNTYDSCNGLLATLKDVNNQTTTYNYDSMERSTGMSYPDGGQTTIQYADGSQSTITTTRKIDNIHNLTTVSVLDTLGRVSQSQLDDPDCSNGVDKTDYTFDALGRIFKISNPYCSTSDPTYGVTTYQYDALGRQILVTQPDGNTVQTTYTGRATDVRDEGNGNKKVERITQADALGRIASVCEVSSATLVGNGGTPSACSLDAPGIGFLTSYGYDALNNLMSVSQASTNRTFVYDGLSRLTSAYNPESGTITYKYDLDTNCPHSSYTGGLISKTDARGIRTCMQYDGIHELLGKTYSDGTPTVSYNYGEPSKYGHTLYNTVERRSSESTTNGTGELFSYDAMGRPTDNSQCTPQNCSNNTAFSVTYATFDGIGNVLSSTNGAGISFGYTYNTAGRFTKLTSSLSDTDHPGVLISNITYDAFGYPVGSSLGNQLNEAFGYTNRGWQNSLSAASSSTTTGTGSIAVSGTEKFSQTVSGTPGTASISVGGGEQSETFDACYPWGCWETIYDGGSVDVTINGFTATANYGAASTVDDIVSQLAGGLNSSSSPVTASVSGTVITVTAKATGAGSNYPISTGANWDTYDFYGASFSAWTTNGQTTLTGGQDAEYNYDTGTVYATINGTQVQATYGQGSTSQSVAADLASKLAATGWVSASANGNIISLTSSTPGWNGNYALTFPASTGTFSPPSFSAAGSLGGGTGGTSYSFTISSFAPNGDVRAANDSVNGNWSYTYDDFNRLSTATSNTGEGCSEAYDRYGNRWQQNPYNGSCLAPSYSFTGNNNRIDGYSYDAAGNLLNDTFHSYTYDAENRIVAVDGGSTATYVYNADGQRVRKTTSAGTVDYLHDLAGHTITELSSSGAWNRGEIYIGARHLATYISNTTIFTHSDWIGNERARSQVNGSPNSSWTSLPFGEGSSTPNPGSAHLTGKDRDSESGLDYFGVRYYSSVQARWASPDAAGLGSADLSNPQSLNEYEYVLDDPLGFVDPDGFAPKKGVTVGTVWITYWQKTGETHDFAGMLGAGGPGVAMSSAPTSQSAGPYVNSGATQLYNAPNQLMTGNNGFWCPFTCVSRYIPNGGHYDISITFETREVPHGAPMTIATIGFVQRPGTGIMTTDNPSRYFHDTDPPAASFAEPVVDPVALMSFTDDQLHAVDRALFSTEDSGELGYALQVRVNAEEKRRGWQKKDDTGLILLFPNQ